MEWKKSLETSVTETQFSCSVPCRPVDSCDVIKKLSRVWTTEMRPSKFERIIENCQYVSPDSESECDELMDGRSEVWEPRKAHGDMKWLDLWTGVKNRGQIRGENENQCSAHKTRTEYLTLMRGGRTRRLEIGVINESGSPDRYRLIGLRLIGLRGILSDGERYLLALPASALEHPAPIRNFVL